MVATHFPPTSSPARTGRMRVVRAGGECDKDWLHASFRLAGIALAHDRVWRIQRPRAKLTGASKLGPTLTQGSPKIPLSTFIETSRQERHPRPSSGAPAKQWHNASLGPSRLCSVTSMPPPTLRSALAFTGSRPWKLPQQFSPSRRSPSASCWQDARPFASILLAASSLDSSFPNDAACAARRQEHQPPGSSSRRWPHEEGPA